MPDFPDEPASFTYSQSRMDYPPIPRTRFWSAIDRHSRLMGCAGSSPCQLALARQLATAPVRPGRGEASSGTCLEVKGQEELSPAAHSLLHQHAQHARQTELAVPGSTSEACTLDLARSHPQSAGQGVALPPARPPCKHKPPPVPVPPPSVMSGVAPTAMRALQTKSVERAGSRQATTGEKLFTSEISDQSGHSSAEGTSDVERDFLCVWLGGMASMIFSMERERRRSLRVLLSRDFLNIMGESELLVE